MMRVPIESASPYVKLHVAFEKTALFVRNNGVEEIRACSEVAAPAVNNLKAFSLACSQSLSREALSLPEAHKLVFVEARLYGWAQLDEGGGGLVLSGGVRFAPAAILWPRLTQ